MKPKLFSFLTACGLAASLSASGATLTWNGAGGGGAWDTASPTWLDGASAVTWNNTLPDRAVFGSTGIGPITLSESITVNTLTVDSAGYTFSGNSLGFGGATPAIVANADFSIASDVVGTDGYTKSGAGVVTFTGTKSITGPVIIAAGSANISTGSAGSALTVATGATATTTAGNAAGYATACRAWNISGTFNLGTAGDSAWTTNATLSSATMGSVTGANWSFGGGSQISNTGTSTFSAGGRFVLREGNPGNTLPITNSGTLIFDLPVTGGNHVAFSGAGTVILNAANTYTGNTTVDAGTLALGSAAALPSTVVTFAPGALFNVSAVPGGFAVAAGKTLSSGRAGIPATDITGDLTVSGTLNPGGTAGLGSLSIAGNLSLNGGTINFDRSGASSDIVHLTGGGRALTLAGTTTLRAATGTFSAGTYTLIDGVSSSTGGGANLAWGSGLRGQTATFAVTGGALQMTLDNGTPAAVTWSGSATSTVWDANASLNWNAGTEKFYSSDAVTFADNPVSAAVTLSGQLEPGSIAFTNASTAYIVRGGTGAIVGSAALTKSGAGSVALWNNANTFSGGTTITAGTISLNSGAALAAGSYSPLGTGPIALNGGTLQINPGNNSGGTYTFPNAITLNGGVLFQDDGVNHFPALLTVSAPSTIRTQYNLKDVYLDGGISGSVPLTITDVGGNYGSGAVHVGANGTYSGTVTVDASAGGNGSLVLRADNALSAASIVLETNAADDVYGPTPVGLTLAGTATNVTIAGLNGINSNSRVHNADATPRTLTINNAVDNVYHGRIGGAPGRDGLSLVKNGSGILTLTGANTYTGTTTVNAGRLVIPSNQTGTGAIAVNDGAALGVSAVPGSVLAPTGLTLGATSGASLSIQNFGGTNPAAPAPLNVGALTTHGTVTLSVVGDFAVGRFPLIQYPAGTIGGAGFNAFVLGAMPPGVTATLENDPATGTIDLVVSSVSVFVWNGVNGASWDITTANWGPQGAPVTFVDGSAVSFNDSALTTAVTLNTTVSPLFTTVNTPAKGYAISGSGSIAGTGGLTKSGAAALTLSTVNSFSGAVTISNGSLVLGADGSVLGSTAGPTRISGTGVLDLNGHAAGAEPLELNGTGAGGTGALVNNSTSPASIDGAVLVAGDSSFGGDGSLGMTGVISGAGTLQKVGFGTMTLTSSHVGPDPFTGNLVIAEGEMVIARTGGYGRIFNNNITVQSGATLTGDTFNFLQGYPGVLTVESGATLAVTPNVTSNIGGTFIMQGGSVMTGEGLDFYGSWHINTSGVVLSVAGGAASPATISAKNISAAGAALTLNVADVTGDADPDLLFTGTLGNQAATAFGLTVTGGGSVVLGGTNIYTGNTLVETGSLTLADDAQMKFRIGANGVNTSISGAGSLLLNGDFNLDLSAAEMTDDNSWLLVDVATLTEFYGASFSVIGFTETAGVWTKVDGNNRWTYTEATGVLKLSIADAYWDWADTFEFASSEAALPDADPDFDGIPNALELVLGGEPIGTENSSLLPTQTWVTQDLGDGMADYVQFTFRRTVASVGLNPGAVFSENLVSPWTPAAGAPGVVVVPTSINAELDQIDVYIPRALHQKLFVRLAVTVP